MADDKHDAASGRGKRLWLWAWGLATGTAGIAGATGLTKTGNGTVILRTQNSYVGATTVSGGTLAGIGANAFGSTSGISIAGAGILSLRGDSSTGGTPPLMQRMAQALCVFN